VKHQIKTTLRDAWARLLFHTGLFRLVGRLMPRRLTILAGHCVEDRECNGDLPADMKLSEDKLRDLLGFLGRHFDLCTVGQGLRRLAGTEPGVRSMVALSMDDGYKDNHRTLMPLLEAIGASATVFLESRALDERLVNWSHKYFWLLCSMDATAVARGMMAASTDEDMHTRLESTLLAGGDLAYRVKRVLKYDVDASARNSALDALFETHGGDERALCDQLYMTWADARELQGRGFELGGHTVRHDVLSTLTPQAARAEIMGGRDALKRELGQKALFSFAYPFGRHWDYDQAAMDGVEAAGFELAVTTHAGVVTPGSDKMRLPRLMLDEETPLHLLVAEACGGFELLRRFGLNLSE
jgi:peptidoglycan/xylan/chitin deacetylase (PgdA/CDA1 family)